MCVCITVCGVQQTQPFIRCFVSSLFCIYWFVLNSLWRSDAIWRHRTGSTLAQVMTCCLTAPNHYLDQCWRIISRIQWHLYPRAILYTKDTSAIAITQISLKFTYLKFYSNLSWVNKLMAASLELEIAYDRPTAGEIEWINNHINSPP